MQTIPVMPEKLLTWKQATELPRPLVLTNGTYDLIHPSHVKRLWIASQYGRSLVVSLDTDQRILRLKDRLPALSVLDRTAVIAPYPFVDGVIWHSDFYDLSMVITLLRPEVWVAKPYPPAEEREAAWEARTRFVPLARQGPHSTTRLRDRLLVR
jgi:bifunctional ADP-heptose synthase (sugar kinase/adenylyltransferase)